MSPSSTVTDIDPTRPSSAFVDAERVAIDTEFMRERTYFAQLCLVQLGTGRDIGLLDPLGTSVADSFWSALFAKSWVLHSGRQDLEVLYQATGKLPAAVFDTQVAAALAGLAPQIGYAGLVESLFGRQLPKSQTRADWTRRPLTDKMREYAAEDVAYLLEAAAIMEDKLAAAGRLGWAQEDSAALLDVALYEVDAALAVDRVRAARHLSGRARRAAVALSSWREERAIRADRPRQWILKDAILIEIAQRFPTTRADLADVPGLPDSTLRRSGDELLQQLRDADASADSYLPPGRPGEPEKKALKAMQREVARVAKELDVAPEVIAAKKDLSAMLQGVSNQRVLQGWRRGVIGDRLAPMLP